MTQSFIDGLRDRREYHAADLIEELRTECNELRADRETVATALEAQNRANDALRAALTEFMDVCAYAEREALPGAIKRAYENGRLALAERR